MGIAESKRLHAVSKAGVLNLSSRKIKHVGDEVRDACRNLRSVDISCNVLTHLPEWIGVLQNLKILNLGRNHILELPPGVKGLVNLQKLDLSHNNLKSLIPELCQLPALTHLDASNNRIEVVHELVFECPRLWSLNLSGNRLESISANFANCSLVELVLSSNRLAQIPSNLHLAKDLKVLRVDANKLELSSIPSSLLSDSNLVLFECEKNMFKPSELVNVCGYDAYMDRYVKSKKKL